MMRILSKGFIVLVLILCVSNLKAQQEKHFVFIQSENKQPYYINLNGQTYNSTKSGYTIISQLLAGKYYFTISFPKNQYPEQKFIVDINMNDRGTGYSLKQFAEKGWGLFNILDYSIIMADNDQLPLQKDTTGTVIEKKEAIPVAVIANEKEPEKQISRIDTVEAVRNTAMNYPLAITKTKPVDVTAMPVAAALMDKQPSNNKKVTKTFELISAKSVDQIYIDQSRKKADTIALFFSLTPKQDTIPVIKHCSNIATDDDFHKTRLDMAAATTNEFMLVTAKNYFKIKCYTIVQIKNLGVLFLSEESRLQFFETAKPFLSDPENYPSLESQFIKPESIEKFRLTVQSN